MLTEGEQTGACLSCQGLCDTEPRNRGFSRVSNVSYLAQTVWSAPVSMDTVECVTESCGR